MTLPQLAALLDQLKRPIEEAPRENPSKTESFVLGLFDNGIFPRVVVWAGNALGWMDEYSTPVHPTHFLPLPTPGPVEFEVVPVGASEATIDYLLREQAERAYLSGLETGAEVARLEEEE